MAILDTKHKQKSSVITAIIVAIIIFIVFNFGLRYFDPPLEYGISVNFGTTDFGRGNVQPKEALKPVQQNEEVAEEQEIPEEIPAETKPEEVKEEAVAEEVLTQETEEALAIKKQEDIKKKAEAKEKARKEKERLKKERIEREKKAAEEKKRKEQEAKRKQLDALMGGINTKGNATGGEGDDNKPGDKGKVTGDPNAKGYYGIGGNGSGGNYRLGNRKALAKPKPDYNCNEEGNVYVVILVDKNGRVISAKPGAKGTTNSAPCLLESAKKAALKTKFSADSNAPVKQVGLIIYNFSLSE
ncbi:MAG: energy transducer TonB [Flavobacteriia bacterium]|nr:MAG: energy transducer TonB [Flavobacteriia bacterium]